MLFVGPAEYFVHSASFLLHSFKCKPGYVESPHIFCDRIGKQLSYRRAVTGVT